MNCKSVTLAAAVYCTLLAGCSQKPVGTEDVVTVDFHDYVEKSLSEMPDKFYSDKRYVALHTDNPDLWIGEIGKVVLHDNRIYVNERTWGEAGNHKLVMHDADGRAIAKIGTKGRGPGEYLQISDYDVDINGRVHLLDTTLDEKKVFIYTPDGNFVEEKRLPFNALKLKCTSDDGYLFALLPWGASEYTGKRVIKTDADLLVTASASDFNMEQVDRRFFLGVGLTSSSDGVACVRPPDENILLFDANGNIEKTIFCDFGKNTIPPAERGNLEPIVTTDRNKSYRHLTDFTVPWGKYIFGIMIDKGKRREYVYDIAAGVMYTVTKEEAGDCGAFTGISDGRLVTSFSDFDGETLPSDLPETLHTGVLNGDPLICLYELK